MTSILYTCNYNTEYTQKNRKYSAELYDVAINSTMKTTCSLLVKF